MEDFSLSDVDLAGHVKNALKSVQSGDGDHYNQLVALMHFSKGSSLDQVALLVTSLKALSGVVSCIDVVHHVSLLKAIFGMSMWNCRSDVMEALREVIISLATTNAIYLGPCLEMLVSNFMPPVYMIDMLKQPWGQSKKESVLSALHSALADIIKVVPIAASRLSSIVIHWMPMTFNKNLHKKEFLKDRTEIYVQNMFRLECGIIKEFVGSRILLAVVSMLIELDVAIGWDDIVKDDSSKCIFVMDAEDGYGFNFDNDDDDDGEFCRPFGPKSLGTNIVAQLLDNLMVQMFEHLDFCQSKKCLIGVFETLLESFLQTILNTHKSKFAQFVLFYACALDHENCGMRFAKTLVEGFLHGGTALSRMSSVAYLGSYLARAVFLPIEFVSEMLERLVDWCFHYCKTKSLEKNGVSNPKLHQVFYSGCQAILYVLCFHMRSMVMDHHMKSRLMTTLGLIVVHKLNPLQVCQPSVVREFLKQAKAAGLFATYMTLDVGDMVESALSKEFGGPERLDSFFPFDQWLLKRSDRFIKPYYRYWRNVQAYDSEEEEEDDDDDDSGHEELADRGCGNDFACGEKIYGADFAEAGEWSQMSCDELGGAISIDEFDHAMNKMSINPRTSLGFGIKPQVMPFRIRPSTSPESL